MEGAMTPKLYLTILSVVTFVYGLGLLLVPGPTLAVYDGLQEPHVLLTAQFFGAALTVLALITWFARDFEWSAVRKLLSSMMLAEVLFAVLSILGVLRGLINAAGWSTVVINVLFLVGAIYLYTREPVSSSQAQRRPA
jgi:uncharacterized membrane protein